MVQCFEIEVDFGVLSYVRERSRGPINLLRTFNEEPSPGKCYLSVRVFHRSRVLLLGMRGCQDFWSQMRSLGASSYHNNAFVLRYYGFCQTA